MTLTGNYIEVAVSGPLIKTFTYELPDNSPGLALGQRVLVPFGRSKKVGFYLGEARTSEGMQIKKIIKVLDEVSYFPEELFRLCRWLADYYFANPADCLSAALPPVMKTHHSARLIWNKTEVAFLPSELKRLIKIDKPLSKAVVNKIISLNGQVLRYLIKENFIRQEWRAKKLTGNRYLKGFKAINPDLWPVLFEGKKPTLVFFDGLKTRGELKAEGWTEYFIKKALAGNLLLPQYEEPDRKILDFVKPHPDVADLQLTAQQEEVTAHLVNQIKACFKVYLLHGVTGSGKTIVYCHVAREVLKENKTVLVLTPEISLSGAILAYFRGFFGSKVTVIHSAMTERERFESWQGISAGRYRIVVGPRSALFAPLVNPGLIIVDEEHDGAYKQDDPAPRFNGRDAAIMRAKINNIPVLLGSASPSVETYYHARTGRYQLLELTERPGEATLPAVHLVDMRKERLKGDLPFMSYPLKKEVEACLEREEQVILFLNRRGYAPQLKCTDCGHVPTCPSCRVTLTYHRTGHKLSCHYCGYVRFHYDACEKCGSGRFLYLGTGTQKVEENIPRLFEKGLAVRFDSDAVSVRCNSYRILTDFAERKYNLLLGTQMVTKGLDLPGVTLVGVLSADMGLDLPDFRASEKTFARLLQVAGRSGRRERKGKVLIQTYYTDNEVITDAARQDYRSFFEREIVSRQRGSFPPFIRLVNFIFSGPDDSRLDVISRGFREHLHKQIETAGIKAMILGPAPCPIRFLRKKYRRHLLVKTRQIQKLTRLLRAWEAVKARFGLPSTVKIIVDVDPDNMM
ncbi:MAG: primosomal protein N' [candidate division Zixibacteria bacterium]|nr:primosomal protein N' [candidate division Zixibacteria bacterium]